MSGVNIEEELKDEIKDLIDRGFEASWMGDLQPGDIFAGPRLFKFNPARGLFVVERIMKVEASYFDPEDDCLVHNQVMNLIVTDEEGLTRHLSYGTTHEIYIYKGEI